MTKSAQEELAQRQLDRIKEREREEAKQQKEAREKARKESPSWDDRNSYS